MPPYPLLTPLNANIQHMLSPKKNKKSRNNRSRLFYNASMSAKSVRIQAIIPNLIINKNTQIKIGQKLVRNRISQMLVAILRPPAEGPGGGPHRLGPPPRGPWEGRPPRGLGTPSKIIRSPDRLYKAPTDYTTPQKGYTKPRQTIQAPERLYKPRVSRKYQTKT